MELNLTCYLHCIVRCIIHYGQLFKWDGIYVHLVTANKFLTSLLKACSALTILLGNHYTSHEPPPLMLGPFLF
jgi:ubiquitin C-terminal hydrolase